MAGWSAKWRLKVTGLEPVVIQQSVETRQPSLDPVASLWQRFKARPLTVACVARSRGSHNPVDPANFVYTFLVTLPLYTPSDTSIEEPLQGD